MDKIKGVDVLVINSLRKTEHMSHMTLTQTLEVIERVKPKQAFLIHLGHDMGLHEDVSRSLPEGVFIAYDTQIVKF